MINQGTIGKSFDMANTRTNAALFLAGALVLAGCAENQDATALWPSLDGSAPAAPQAAPAAQQTAPQAANTSNNSLFGNNSASAAPVGTAAQPAGTTPLYSGVNSSSPAPANYAAPALPTVTPGQPTGTHVGLRVVALRQDLARLQNSIQVHGQTYQKIRPSVESNAQAYQQTVAPLYARLQVGTTPGNPQLVQHWNEAEMRLDRVNDDIDQLNALGNAVVNDAAMGSYMLENVRATYGLAGAYEEDHRQLALLEDETNRTVIAVDRLLSDISTDINRQGNYVAAERANLTALALAIKTGSFFDSPIRDTGAGLNSTVAGDPMVVVRFDQPNLNYEPALSAAIQDALGRNPNSVFDVVGVSSAGAGTSEARIQAERVYKSLVRMGVRPDRVNLSAISGEGNHPEVHIYTR